MTFVETTAGLSGTAIGASETVQLRDVTVEPGEQRERVTWSQTITKPMRLNLDFEVTVDGDRLQGYSRAGRLPRSAVDGSRIPNGREGEDVD